MATGGDGDEWGNGGNGFIPPKTPKMVVKDDPGRPLQPDTEENVIRETGDVFQNFVKNMQATDTHSGEADDTPNYAELGLLPSNPLSDAATVGRRLAQIGDDINARYAAEFNNMVKILNPSPDTAFEAFLHTTDRLFRDGVISWGRVITLLCFGYRLAVVVVKKGIRGFFATLINFIIEYLAMRGIARWIANQGGWRAVFNLVPETVGWFGVGVVVSVAAATVIAVLLISSKK